MSPLGRPQGEYQRAQPEGPPANPPERPKGEYRRAQPEGSSVIAPCRPQGKDREAQPGGAAQTDGWTLLDTALGPMGVAWGRHGIRLLQLPDPDRDRLRARMRRLAAGPGPVPPSHEVQSAIDDIRALLRGEPVDLGAVRLDMRRIAAFERLVFAAARGIPRGSVLTYGELAERLGDRRLARAVGQALARNPFAPVVPCHRVLAAGGRAGGFSAPGGVRSKWRLLQVERARLSAEPGLFDDG